MFTVYAIVEGQTEERFVKDVLNPGALHPRIHAEPILLGNSRPRANRGGKVNWERVRNHIETLRAEHGNRPDVGFTTLLDYYRLPPDFPGMAHQGSLEDRIAAIERQLSAASAHPRFVPYVQVHEFEALLFCDTSVFEMQFPGTENRWVQLSQAAANFSSPEEIDNGPDSSPAKRIEAVYPGYQKVAHGAILAGHIGLPAMRAQCPHFSAWLDRLTALAQRT